MSILTGILAAIGLVVLVIIGAAIYLVKGKGNVEKIRNGFIRGAKQGAIRSLADTVSRENPEITSKQAEENIKAIIEEVKKRKG